MNNKFSENLKKIRKDNNLSQEQLADELGVSRQAISKWESAVAYPEMDKIIAICDKFNLNIDDLLHKDIKEVKGEEESKNKINNFVDDILKFITNTIDLFTNMNFKTKIKCIFEECIIAGILFVLSLIVYYIFDDLFGNIIRFLPNNVYYYVINFLDSILIVALLVISIVLMINIFKTRYLDYYEKITNDNNNDNKLDVTESKEEILKDTVNKNDKIIIRDPKHSEYKFISFLLKTIVGIIKFFALIFSLCLVVVLIALFCAFIISFLLYKTGFFFIGLLATILSSSIITIVIMLVIFNFVFNRLNDKKKMIWSFLGSLIVFGIGCGLIAVGTISFDVMGYDKSQLKTISKEYEMNNELILFPYDEDYNIEYVVSNNDNIKIEYSIFKYFSIEDHLYKDSNQLMAWTYCKNPLKLVRNYIKNINDRKIFYLNDRIEKVTVYTSKSNIEKLKNNVKNYLDLIEQENDLRNSFEKSINELENENNELRQKVDELEDELNKR